MPKPANHMYGHSMLVIGGLYHTESLRKPNRKFLVPQKNFNSKNRATSVIVILVKDYAV